jgi:eukaryotic-like serine/threonine-protein kinase
LGESVPTFGGYVSALTAMYGLFRDALLSGGFSRSRGKGSALSRNEQAGNPSVGESRRPATTLLSQGAVLESRYEILRICGRGGMSTVYAARDLRFSHVERLCAVKEMQVEAPDNRTRVLQIRNFEREAEMLATLSHPAIPKIFDFFTIGGLVYLVLEFIEGQDLEAMIESRDAPFDEQTLADWAIQILDVLEYLHSHEPEPIVFRDLKPSNIMLRADAKITLIDFGIARTFQPMQRGTMIGTEGYAPPEQYRGVAEPRGDLYALGATLHHMATKSDPRSETPFTFEQRKPTNLNPALSEQFENVVMRALAYNAADRFESAKAMRDALRSLSPQIANGQLPAQPPARNGTRVFDVKDARPAHDPWLSQPQPVESKPAYQPSEVPARERVLWSIPTGDEVRASATIGFGLAFIGSYDGYLYAASLESGTVAWKFRCQRGISSRPAVLDDQIIFGSEDQHVYSLHVRDGRQRWSFRTAMAVRSSPAAYGEMVIIGSDDAYCYCVDARSGDLNWRQRAWGPVRSSPVLHKDSVIVGSDDGTVYRLSVSDGRVIWRFHVGSPVLSSPTVEGNVVLIGGYDGQIYGVDFATGRVLWSVGTQRPILASPRTLGGTAFVGSTDGAVYAVSVQDGEEFWRNQIANQITSSIGIYGGYGYVGTIDGYVHCLNLGDGETVWRHRIGKPVTSSPAIGDDTVVVGCLDGRIYGLRL